MKITVLGAILIIAGVVLLVVLARSNSPQAPPKQDSGETDITPDGG